MQEQQHSARSQESSSYVSSPRSGSEESYGDGGDRDSFDDLKQRALKKALEQNPIRTRYVPKDRGKAEKLKARRKAVALARRKSEADAAAAAAKNADAGAPGPGLMKRGTMSMSRRFSGSSDGEAPKQVLNRKASTISAAFARRPSLFGGSNWGDNSIDGSEWAGSQEEGEAAPKSGLRSLAKGLWHSSTVVADRGKYEWAVLKGAVKDIAQNSITRSVTGEGQDRVVFEIISAVNKSKVEETPEVLGCTMAQWEHYVRIESLGAIKDGTGQRLEGSQFKRMKGNGRFFCGAREAVQMAERRYNEQNGQNKITRDELSELIRVSRNKAKGRGQEFQKSTVDVSILDDVQNNNQGGPGMKKLAAAHEVLADFGDIRVSMPRYLTDAKAGQMSYIVPTLNAAGNYGEVLLKTKVPHRHAVGEPPKLEAFCDLDGLDQRQAASAGSKDSPLIKDQSHLHQAKKPKSNDDWQHWRELQAKKRQAALESQDWRLQRQTTTVKAVGRELDNETDSDASSPEVRSGKSKTSGSPASPSSPTRRRNAILSPTGVQGSADRTPWDCRRPPAPDEVDLILEQIDWVDPDRTDVKAEAAAAATAHGSPGDDPEEQQWIISAVGASFELAFTIGTAASSLPEEDSGAGDDAFWDDVFQP
eukprot:CAMPEP_0180694116 /NCGR_PEP_ID=MMETSP1038_2-20121128/1732_1 /TAXON_ID=632150 /ORGANISM="Azadinium spinosum, Strain 3D9" /LENGTH=646 /DNA_ID=CAMNT_0022725423 /DNA_START=85 /DNA_END=2022 /DNA_ORIENTATION=+